MVIVYVHGLQTFVSSAHDITQGYIKKRYDKHVHRLKWNNLQKVAVLQNSALKYSQLYEQKQRPKADVALSFSIFPTLVSDKQWQT